MAFGFAPAESTSDTPRVRRTRSQEFVVQLESHRRRIAHELSLHLREPVAVVWHTNRHSMLSVKRLRLGYQFRMHVVFATSEPQLVNAIARLARNNDRDASVMIDRFILENANAIADTAQPRDVITAGEAYDLQKLFSDLNERFFENRVNARITWGRGSAGRRRSIKLGSYHASERLIRVHPALDQTFVPKFFIDFVIFHEMLHEQLGVTEQGGRRCVHPPEFRALEARFPEAKEAWAWERAHIQKLLKS